MAILGADRPAQRHLAASHFAARQQQAGDVGAGDQQHQPHCPEQQCHGRSDVLEHLVRERRHLDRAFFVGVEIRSLELLSDADHLGLRRVDTDAVLQARQHRERSVASLVQRIRRERCPGRRPDRRLIAPPCEALGRDADDREHTRVELNRLADRVGAAIEPLLPEPLANHGHGRGVRTMVAVLQDASGDRLDAEQLEVRAVHDLAIHQLRLAGAVDDEAAAEPRGHGIERPRLPPVEVVGERRAATLHRLALNVAPELDQAIGLRIRQRPQQHRIQQPEDRRRRADPESEREHRAHRRRRAFPDRSPRIPQVGSHTHLGARWCKRHAYEFVRNFKWRRVRRVRRRVVGCPLPDSPGGAASGARQRLRAHVAPLFALRTELRTAHFAGLRTYSPTSHSALRTDSPATRKIRG